MSRRLLIPLLIGALSSPLAGAEDRPLWLVSGPAELLREVEALAQHRRTDGFDVQLSETQPAAAIASCPRPPDYLLILGDTLLHGAADPSWASPTPRGSQYRWREVQPETFAADPAWADLDEDGIPEFPVGRIPARSPEEVAKVVAKTLAFERRELSPDDLGLPIWGGTPAYGKLLDEGGTTMLLSIVRKHAPRWTEPWMIFGNPRSPLSADGYSQPDLFNGRLGRGGYITAMIGHGSAGSFYSQQAPRGEISYLVGHAARLATGAPSPPHIILACDCGNFARDRPSLAEAMLFAPAGPVNVVAATTESHPLTNYYSALAVLDRLDANHARFGDLWHASQLQAYGTKQGLTEALLKNAEGALEAKIDIPKLKRDQLLMYALLGDPATRLPSVSALEIKVTPDGDGWRWEAAKPKGTTALHFSLRRPSQPPHSKPEGADRATALRLFDERNDAWRFEPIAKYPAAAAWAGRISDPGLLRLVAIVPGGLRVANHLLERPE